MAEIRDVHITQHSSSPEPNPISPLHKHHSLTKPPNPLSHACAVSSPHPLGVNPSNTLQSMPLMAVSTAPPHSSFWPQSKPLSPSFSLSLTLRSRPELTLLGRYRLCRAAKQQQAGPSKKRPGKRKPSEKPASREAAAVEVVAPPARQSQPSSIPKPPAGFVLDPHGKVLLASSKRITTIVDTANNLPLECVIRRVFQSSRGDECMLLCPVDTPVQILKSTNFNGWSTVDDDEIEAIIPSVAYALAKIHMHLVVSGFCYTARGGFCYSEEDILEFGTDDGEDIDGLPTEGIEITCFHMDGAHYMIYAPSDPLLFVAVKDKNGLLQIADDELLEDAAIIAAVDEETEFNALVEEEAALLESLLGKR